MKIKFNFNILKWFDNWSTIAFINIMFIITISSLSIIFIIGLFTDTKVKSNHPNKHKITNHSAANTIVKPAAETYINDVVVYSTIMYEHGVTLSCIKYEIYVDNKLFKTKMIIDTLPPYFVDEYGNKIKYKYHITSMDKSNLTP